MSIYPKFEYETGRGTSVTQPDRLSDKLAQVKPNLPGSVIVIHGVNDVGVSFGAVERGLCAGLGTRLNCEGRFQPASYRMPLDSDKDKLENDPDAVFFKRQLQEGHCTPVIPFYWGFREDAHFGKTGTHKDNVQHGQCTDRFGNRLDKDLSKGGGPFANATDTLVDMWNKGFGSGPFDLVDRQVEDPLRPVLDAPGRMYMILAAKRLAALISMIRDYDANEAVSIVAHSQGCMLSLLAQAFLMQQGLRPADTLVLTHPPYSLTADLPPLETLGEWFTGGVDHAMESKYDYISDRQTVHARLQTLVNIVHGVVERKHTVPELTELTDHGVHRGMVGSKWQAGTDRDNRGKVYLYFCPEDMTVALYTMRGIGWQGVPDYVDGPQTTDEPREALSELMKLNGKDQGFFQRVFTGKLRATRATSAPQPVLVGIAPHDFALRLKGENAHGHADKELDKRRASAPEVDVKASTEFPGFVRKNREMLREGIRRITGEALKTPVKADMNAGAIVGTSGQLETVDPIDASIATTSRYGAKFLWKLVDDPSGASSVPVKTWTGSPNALLYKEKVAVSDRLAEANHIVNAGATHATQRREVVDVYLCLTRPAAFLNPCPIGKLLVRYKESADEVRLREQKTGTAPRSFHSAIFGSMANHEHVTAYDLAIGGGKAVSHPLFYKYLCAVADWRLKKPSGQEVVRPGILEWKKFQVQFARYYDVEPSWRRALIEGGCEYYSTGRLPKELPVLPAELPPTIVSVTLSGRIIEPSKASTTLRTEAVGKWLKLKPMPKGDGSASVT